MRPVSSLRFALLGAAVLSVLALQARAAPEKEPPMGGVTVPLKELTQEKLRKAAAEAIKASRDNPPHDKFWKEIDKLVVLDPETIVYEHEKGSTVEGDMGGQADPRPERGQARKALEDLHNVFDHVLWGQNLGGEVVPPGAGLVDKADAKAIIDVAHLEIGPNPESEPKPEPKPEPVKPPVMPPAESSEEVSRLRRELDDTRRELDELRQNLDEKRLKELEEKRQKDLDETRLQLEKLRLELDDLRRQGDKREKDLDAARAEADKRQKDLDETRLQLEKLRVELDDLRKQGDKRDKDLDDLRREGEKRQKELDGARAKAERRQKDLEDTRVQVDKLRQDLEDLRREGEKRERTLDELKRENERRRRELDATRTEGERRQRRIGRRPLSDGVAAPPVGGDAAARGAHPEAARCAAEIRHGGAAVVHDLLRLLHLLLGVGAVVGLLLPGRFDRFRLVGQGAAADVSAAAVHPSRRSPTAGADHAAAVRWGRRLAAPGRSPISAGRTAIGTANRARPTACSGWAIAATGRAISTRPW